MLNDGYDRHEAADRLRKAMGDALAQAWLNGERDRVIGTLETAKDAPMLKQWKDDVAEALPPSNEMNF